MPQTLTVELGPRSYDIHIAKRLGDEIGRVAGQLNLGPACLVVSDSNVDPVYGDGCENSLLREKFSVGRAVVPAGESSKSGEQLFNIYEQAINAGLDRSSFVVALGGGVIGDLAGYAAASFMRGIALIQVPTTLLAMVDSAIGGKTGINLPQGKNLVGAFHQPVSVIADLNTLRTLPLRELRSGLAEVVKYGVIHDEDILTMLEGLEVDKLNSKPESLEEIIMRGCAIKADVVCRDERESGLRAVLNFGHTVGHAIEQATGYGRYLHGEAVSMGMVFASRLSVRLSGMSESEYDRLVRLLDHLGLPVRMPDFSWVDIRKAMEKDKKRAGGSIRFVLAERLGSVKTGIAVSDEDLEEVWNGCR